MSISMPLCFKAIYGIKMDVIQLGQLTFSPNLIPRNTGMFSQILSTVNRRGLESIRDIQKKVLRALMGHDKTMRITRIKL